MHGSYDICSIMHPHWSSSVRRDGETNMYMTTISFLRMLFLDPVGSLVSTLLVIGCWLLVTLFQNLFILSVVVL